MGKPSADVFKGESHRTYYEGRFHQQIDSGQLSVFEGDSSAKMAQRDDGRYDVIYIDGDHSYDGVLRDAEIAARKIRHDGFLVFNDYTMADHLTARQNDFPVQC
jgi:Methyltransferase domain